MPNLLEFLNASNDPTLVTDVPSNVQVEPLDGPTTIDSVMDRFPEEVYQQGPDTHIYRLLQALCGDAGAGLAKKAAYIERLKWEAQLFSFGALDQFGTTYKFRRLRDETYQDNWQDALTPEQWDAIFLADQSYRHRLADFFNATRLGQAPDGMALASQSGSGIPTEIFEQYRYIFDLYSDDPLGIDPLGETISTSEYVVIPRLPNAGDGDSHTYQRSFTRSWTFTEPTFNSSVHPPTITTPLSVAADYDPLSSEFVLLPEIERNIVEVLDRIGPKNALATITLDEDPYTEIATAHVFASSERLHVNRFVTGSSSVTWPETDPEGNFFIENGVENESGYFYGGARELPAIFHTAETVNAYTDQALVSPDYNTADFYSGTLPDSVRYKSESPTNPNATFASIFPFLQQAPDGAYPANMALAVHDTPLVMESGVMGS